MGKRRRPPTTTQDEDDTVIPEGEQWRLIEESGVIQRIKRPTKLNDHDSDAERASEPYVCTPDDEDGQAGDLSDSIFQAALLVIPMCFLYATMDLLCRMQYAQHPTFWEETKRVASVVPVLSALVFYSNNHKDRPLAQAIMFCMSIAVGIRLVWIVNNAGFLTVINQSPPLSVIWVYIIIQLNLMPAVFSLVVVYGLVKFFNLKIVFN